MELNRQNGHAPAHPRFRFPFTRHRFRRPSSSLPNEFLLFSLPRRALYRDREEASHEIFESALASLFLSVSMHSPRLPCEKAESARPTPPHLISIGISNGYMLSCREVLAHFADRNIRRRSMMIGEVKRLTDYPERCFEE